MKYVVILVIVGVAVAGGVLFWRARVSAAADSATAMLTEPVGRRTIEKIVTANGKIASNKDVDIKCQASGEIKTLPYDISDVVKQGDVLMTLDKTDSQRSCDQADAQVDASTARWDQAKLAYQIAQLNLETTRQRAEADLASALANASSAKAKADRTQQLFDAKPVSLASKEDLETAQAAAAQADAAAKNAQAAIEELKQQEISVASKKDDIALAQAQLDQDKIRKDLADRQLGYCTVTAPINGVVSALNVQIGNIVQSGSGGFSGGTTVMTLSDLSHIYMLASVDESDMDKIDDPSKRQVKQPVRVTVDAFPQEVFTGEVVRVATKGVNNTNVVTFEVKIEITSPNRTLLRPEMTATAQIIAASRPDVLAIPLAAFTRASRGDAMDDPPPPPSFSTSPSAPDAAQPATAPASAAAAPGGGRRGGGRGGAGRRGGGNMAVRFDAPSDGTVVVQKPDGTLETRNVTIGLSDDQYCEVLKGLNEGEVVVLNKNGSDSRWRNDQRRGSLMPRGVGRGR